jgi:hypothetical protein
VDQGVAHHGEGAALARAVAKPQVLVVQDLPELLQQAGELLGGDTGLGFVEQFEADAQGLQQLRTVVAPPTRPAQGGAGEMTGDSAFAHEG